MFLVYYVCFFLYKLYRILSCPPPPAWKLATPCACHYFRLPISRICCIIPPVLIRKSRITNYNFPHEMPESVQFIVKATCVGGRVYLGLDLLCFM